MPDFRVIAVGCVPWNEAASERSRFGRGPIQRDFRDCADAADAADRMFDSLALEPPGLKPHEFDIIHILETSPAPPPSAPTTRRGRSE